MVFGHTKTEQTVLGKRLFEWEYDSKVLGKVNCTAHLVTAAMVT